MDCSQQYPTLRQDGSLIKNFPYLVRGGGGYNALLVKAHWEGEIGIGQICLSHYLRTNIPDWFPSQNLINFKWSRQGHQHWCTGILSQGWSSKSNDWSSPLDLHSQLSARWQIMKMVIVMVIMVSGMVMWARWHNSMMVIWQTTCVWEAEIIWFKSLFEAEVAMNIKYDGKEVDMTKLAKTGEK